MLLKDEKIFLLFFLPLFAAKLMDITSDNIILKIIGVWSFMVFFISFSKKKYPQNLLTIYSLLGALSILLFFTSGKQGILFSVLMIIMMRDIDIYTILLKKIIYIGVVFLIITCYLHRDGGVTLRYINGEWTEIVKRSNLIFVSYLAVLNLFLLRFKDNINWSFIIVVSISAYLMSVYTGSRTGMVVVTLLLLQIIFFKSQKIINNNVIKSICIFSPLLCLAFNYYSTLYYERSDIITIIDMMMQGRISQNAAFLNQYGISFFGQRIVENFDSASGDYACLDSAYMDMLISQGLLFTIVWIIITMKVIKYMYDKQKMTEVAILTSYAFYGITETFLINCFLNISWLFYGEYLYAKVEGIEDKGGGNLA